MTCTAQIRAVRPIELVELLSRPDKIGHGLQAAGGTTRYEDVDRAKAAPGGTPGAAFAPRR
jgi:hypothetical protein